MYNRCRSRECREGWTGRRRNYRCRTEGCGKKFRHDGGQLPEEARICPDCLKDPVRFAEYQLAITKARAKEAAEA